MNLFTKQKQTHRLREQTYGYQEGRAASRDRLGALDWHVHTAIFRIDKQQGPTMQHRDHCSVLCDDLNGKQIWQRIDAFICISGSLCCTSETNTPLLVNYNIKKRNWKNKCEATKHVMLVSCTRPSPYGLIQLWSQCSGRIPVSHSRRLLPRGSPSTSVLFLICNRRLILTLKCHNS